VGYVAFGPFSRFVTAKFEELRRVEYTDGENDAGLGKDLFWLEDGLVCATRISSVDEASARTLLTLIARGSSPDS
jgi:hypothetical protein